MKILLLNPPVNIDDPSDYFLVKPPYGLAMISSVLKEEGWDVTLWDAQAFHKTRKEILSFIGESQPDIIGMGSFTFQLGVVISLADDIKRMLPGARIILGGPHVTAEPEMTLQCHQSIDMVVIGEGELVMLELLQKLARSEPLDGINGLAFRKGDRIIVNKKHQMAQDLDRLPMADWDSLPVGLYWDALSTKKAYAILFGSRGCPYSCTFCAAHVTNGRKIRKRSPGNIIAELKHLYEKYGIDEFTFNDSTFTFDREWVIEICREIINLGAPVKWRCTARADTLDEDLLRWMKKSGCIKLLMGIESADPEVLRLMRKGETIDQIINGLKLIRDSGISVDASFILGMPGDTRESIRKSISLAKEIQKYPQNTSALTLATPFPGTRLYKLSAEQGLTVEDWTKFDCFKITYVPQGMTKEELAGIYRRALLELYFLNFPYLLRRLFSINFYQLRINARYALKIILRGMKIKE